MYDRVGWYHLDSELVLVAYGCHHSIAGLLEIVRGGSEIKTLIWKTYCLDLDWQRLYNNNEEGQGRDCGRLTIAHSNSVGIVSADDSNISITPTAEF